MSAFAACRSAAVAAAAVVVPAVPAVLGELVELAVQSSELDLVVDATAVTVAAVVAALEVAVDETSAHFVDVAAAPSTLCAISLLVPAADAGCFYQLLAAPVVQVAAVLEAVPVFGPVEVGPTVRCFFDSTAVSLLGAAPKDPSFWS